GPFFRHPRRSSKTMKRVTTLHPPPSTHRMPSAKASAKTSAKTSGKTANGRASPGQRPIVLRGARQHNLKGVDLDLPRNKLIVFTGPSGSGKSSLVFDTIYAEGQRRYVESLSA